MINISSNIGQHRKNANNLETLINTTNANLATTNNNLNTLNTEVTKTINTSISNINTSISNIKAQYLPLTGGTVTGSIRMSGDRTILSNSVNNASISCHSTKNNRAEGGQLFLLATDSPHISGGGFLLRAWNPDESYYDLSGSTKGVLTWYGDPVVTYGVRNRKTLLFSYSGGYGSGTIQLSQEYTNFNAIAVLIGSDTSNRCLTYVLTPVWAITYAKSIGATGFDISGGRHYWEINLSTSTTTSLTSYSENSRIYAIWGLM